MTGREIMGVYPGPGWRGGPPPACVSEELNFSSYLILINLHLNGSSQTWLQILYWTEQHLAEDSRLAVEARDRKVIVHGQRSSGL